MMRENVYIRQAVHKRQGPALQRNPPVAVASSCLPQEGWPGAASLQKVQRHFHFAALLCLLGP